MLLCAHWYITWFGVLYCGVGVVLCGMWGHARLFVSMCIQIFYQCVSTKRQCVILRFIYSFHTFSPHSFYNLRFHLLLYTTYWIFMKLWCSNWLLALMQHWSNQFDVENLFFSASIYYFIWCVCVSQSVCVISVFFSYLSFFLSIPVFLLSILMLGYFS